MQVTNYPKFNSNNFFIINSNNFTIINSLITITSINLPMDSVILHFSADYFYIS